MAQVNVGEFDVHRQSEWPLYASRIDKYLLMNNIVKDERKIATLLYFAGPDVIKTANHLCNPKKPEELKYSELQDILQKYFDPKPTKHVARLHFQNRRQNRGENTRKFDIALQELAKDCVLGNYLEEALLQQFLWGMSDGRLREQLLTIDDLTYKTAIKTGLAHEAAMEQSKQFQSTTAAEWHQINLVELNGNDEMKCFRCGKSGHLAKTCKQINFAERNENDEMKCYRCGKSGHLAKMCKWKKSKCRNCGKIGHLAEACKNNKQVEIKNTETVNNDQIMLSVKIFDRPFAMEIDSGSGISLMAYRDWKTIMQFHNRTSNLEKTNLIAKDVNGKHIEIVGKVIVPVQTNSKITDLPLYIIHGKTNPIIGRNWFKPMGIKITITKKIMIEKEIRNTFPSLFKKELGEIRTKPVEIQLRENAKPVLCKPRRVPYAQREKLANALEELTNKGVLTPTENSEWATPIVIITKPDGSIRICGDYRITVNPALNKNNYPVPNVREVLATLEGATHYAKLDLNAAFHQIPVTGKSAEILTLTTPFGLFKYNHLPFGITTAPNIFQSNIDQLLRGINGVIPYFDDILIMANSETELQSKVHEVCGKLAKSGARLNEEKCIWNTSEIKFLGHIISNNGKKPMPEKIRAIKNAKTPRNVKELQSFLGLIGYFECFLKGKAHIASKLYELLEKNRKWSWDRIHEDAFKKTKSLLTSDDLLINYNNNEQVILTTDASEYGVGAVISHPTDEGERPIAYASRTLSRSERNYSQLDKEALAIIFGIKKFHQYLYGRHFTAITDHKPLLGIFSRSKQLPDHLSPRMLHWIEILSAYDYSLEYRRGSFITHADALSRIPDNNGKTIGQVSINYIDTWESNVLNSELVAKWTKLDDGYRLLWNWICNGWPIK